MARAFSRSVPAPRVIAEAVSFTIPSVGIRRVGLRKRAKTSRLKGGATVGLAKFRDTVAEFKRFQVSANLASARTPPEVIDKLQKTIAGFADKEVSPKELDPLLKTPADSMKLLRERARQLQEQAAQLRKLAQTVHHERTLAELSTTFAFVDQLGVSRTCQVEADDYSEEWVMSDVANNALYNCKLTIREA